MKPQGRRALDVPLGLVGTNKFGRFEKISVEETFNMIVSDKFLVPFGGYQKKVSLSPNGKGRAIYASYRWGNQISVVNNNVIQIDPNLNTTILFQLDTFTGDVFIDENNSAQIAICDKEALWIYNWSTGAYQKAVLPISTIDSPNPITPGYVTFQDGYFIVPDLKTDRWYLSKVNDGLDWNWGAGGIPVEGRIQTKPTNALACLRAPGRGNLLYVFGATVTELWYNVGAQIFPFQRSISASIDYGCLSANTISAMDNLVAWLGINERSGPVIMISSGGDINHISTDGIDYVLANLNYPNRSTGWFIKQDGHLFYVLSFIDPSDNVTYCYDFLTKGFSTLTDEELDYFIARRIAFFQDEYYFVSVNDNYLYQLSTRFNSYDYRTETERSTYNARYDYLVKEIPFIRNCPPVRMPDTSVYIANCLTFIMEQGDDPEYKTNRIAVIATESGQVIATEGNTGISVERWQSQYVPRVDMSISLDGGKTFSNLNLTYHLNPLGYRQNKIMFWQLGRANDLTCQFRFVMKARVVVGEGVLSLR